MTVQITLRPSGHTFEAEPGENLLESALRAGLALKYNCNNGNCGQCSAKLISGKIGEQLHSDFSFNSSLSFQNPILMCRTKPASDMEIEVVEIGDVSQLPQQEIITKVHRLELINDDIMVLQLRTPRSKTLQFFAGQHVSMHLDELPPRNISIGSCPCNGMFLQFHFRRDKSRKNKRCKNQNDPFTQRIFNQLKQKDEVRITGPYGSFTLDDDSKRPILLVANDTGFAPIKSLIEHAISLEKSQPIRLIWLSDCPEAHYQLNYCRSWADALDNFMFDAITPKQLNLSKDANNDQVMAAIGQIIVDQHRSLDQYDVYLNGPKRRYQNLCQILTDNGLPQERLFIDSIQKY